MESINVLDDFTVFVGDNWYIIEKNGKILDKCVLEFDEQAVEEYSKAVNNIESNKVKKLTFSNSNSII